MGNNRHGATPMIVDYLEDHDTWGNAEEEYEDADEVRLAKCYECGGLGHLARDCPSRWWGLSKGKGKEKDPVAGARGLRVDGKEDIRAKERRTGRARTPKARAIKAW